jgi:hypothetical protein
MFSRKKKRKEVQAKIAAAREFLYRQREHMLMKFINDDSCTTKDIIYATTDIYGFLLDKLKEIEEDIEEC